jgi:hypothetical protein
VDIISKGWKSLSSCSGFVQGVGITLQFLNAKIRQQRLTIYCPEDISGVKNTAAKSLLKMSLHKNDFPRKCDTTALN